MNRLFRVFSFGLLALGVLLGAGCGRAVKVKGQLTKGGKPVTVEKNKGKIAITFHQDLDGGKEESYPAITDPETGAFTVPGRNNKGIPPGKYRVSVQVFEQYPSPKDKFNNAYAGKNTAIVREIKAADMINLELDEFKPAGGRGSGQARPPAPPSPPKKN